jgi:alpha/beta superfamily hydrolase
MDATPISFGTADGVRLAGDIRIPPEARSVVIACHPHPLYGGDRHNIVPTTLSSALTARGHAVLRFDFRGAGDSAGWHGGGEAERMDVVAAIGAALGHVPDRPVILAGYSFGADVALAVADERIAGWCGVAPVLAIFADPAAYLAGPDPRPKLLASAAHDQFCPPAVAAERTAGWVNTKREVIPLADHFLAGATLAVTELVAGFLAGA